MHIAIPSKGSLSVNGIVGGVLPIAVGAALSAKLLKTGAKSVCFFGGGANNKGAFHESLNMACILHNFLNANGALLEHPTNGRSNSFSIERLQRIPSKVVISGGQVKTEILLATLRCLNSTVLQLMNKRPANC